MAQVGPAAHHAMGAVVGPDGRGGRRLGVVGGRVPVAAPLPDVPRGPEDTETVGREGLDRTGREEAVLERVHLGEPALPDVAPPPATGYQLVTPRVPGTDEATACDVLPLRLCGQAFAGPAGVRLGVEPGDVDDGMVLAVLDVRTRSLGGPPGRAAHGHPPRRGVDPVQYVGGAQAGVVPQGQVEHRGDAEVLGVGDPSGLLDEGRELGVRHLGRVDEERRYVDSVDRGLAVARGSPPRTGLPSAAGHQPPAPCPACALPTGARRRRPGPRRWTGHR